MAADLRDIFMHTKSMEWQGNEAQVEIEEEKSPTKSSTSSYDKISSMSTSIFTWIRQTISSFVPKEQEDQEQSDKNQNLRQNYLDENRKSEQFYPHSQENNNDLFNNNLTQPNQYDQKSTGISASVPFNLLQQNKSSYPPSHTQSPHSDLSYKFLHSHSHINPQIPFTDYHQPVNPTSNAVLTNSFSQSVSNRPIHLPQSVWPDPELALSTKGSVVSIQNKPSYIPSVSNIQRSFTPSISSEYAFSKQPRSVTHSEANFSLKSSQRQFHSNNKKSSIFNHLRSHSYIPRIEHGGIQNRSKRSFSDLKPTISYRPVLANEARSDIFPLRQFLPVNSSPINYYTSSKAKRTRSMLGDGSEYSQIQSFSKSNNIQDRASIYSMSDFRSRAEGSIRSRKISQPSVFINDYLSPKLSEKSPFNLNPVISSSAYYPETSIHTQASLEYRIEFSTDRVIESLNSFKNNYLLDINNENSTKWHNLEVENSDNLTNFDIYKKETVCKVNKIGDRAGFLSECQFFQFPSPKVMLLIKLVNYMCNYMDTQSLIKAKVMNFQRSSSSLLNNDDELASPMLKDYINQNSITKYDDFIDKNEQIYEYDEDLIEFEQIPSDNEFLQDLQSLFPGSCPTKTCLDRFIWMLNQTKRMHTELPEDLVYDNIGNKLPIISCTSSISYPVWENIDLDTFLDNNSTIIQELALHFEIILERLTWGAADEGRIIMPIYGKLIGFLLVYSIKDIKNATLTIENISYQSNSNIDNENVKKINEIYLLIYNNIEAFAIELSSRLEREFELRSQMTPNKRNIIISTSKNFIIDKTLLSDDPGINLIFVIDSFYSGLKMTYILSEHYYFLRLFYQYRLHKFFHVEKNSFKKLRE